MLFVFDIQNDLDGSQVSVKYEFYSFIWNKIRDLPAGRCLSHYERKILISFDLNLRAKIVLRDLGI